MKTSNRIVSVLLVLVSPIAMSSCVTVGSIDGIATTDREQQAISEATGAGAAIGALAGAAIVGGIAYSQGARDKRLIAPAALGALGGGAVGAGMGQQAGTRRVQDHRAARAEAQRLGNLVAQARQYNSNVKSYNQRLSQKVSEVQKTKSAEEKRAALLSAKANRAQVSARINKREDVASRLPSSYGSQYRAATNELKHQEDLIDSAIRKLNAVDEEVR